MKNVIKFVLIAAAITQSSRAAVTVAQVQQAFATGRCPAPLWQADPAHCFYATTSEGLAYAGQDTHNNVEEAVSMHGACGSDDQELCNVLVGKTNYETTEWLLGHLSDLEGKADLGPQRLQEIRRASTALQQALKMPFSLWEWHDLEKYWKDFWSEFGEPGRYEQRLQTAFAKMQAGNFATYREQRRALQKITMNCMLEDYVFVSGRQHPNPHLQVIFLLLKAGGRIDWDLSKDGIIMTGPQTGYNFITWLLDQQDSALLKLLLKHDTPGLLLSNLLWVREHKHEFEAVLISHISHALAAMEESAKVLANMQAIVAEAIASCGYRHRIQAQYVLQFGHKTSSWIMQKIDRIATWWDGKQAEQAIHAETPTETARE